MQAKVVTRPPWLAKKTCIYTLTKKILYAKLTYYDHLNKNVEHLIVTWELKFEFNKNKNNATFTTNPMW